MSRKTGEYNMDNGSGGGGDGFMDGPSARAEVERMQADPETRAKYLAGDKAIVDRVNRLVDIYSEAADRQQG